VAPLGAVSHKFNYYYYYYYYYYRFEKTIRKNYVCYEAETKYLTLKDEKNCIRECKQFMYLGVKIDKKNRQKMILRTGLIKAEQ
jgi:hypothetical protein